MDDFGFYINLGLSHILDPNGYDHILFVIALCLVYLYSDWKKITLLVTAFTLGHSLTLALATLRLLSVKTQWVEFLIPVTILLTCINNLFYAPAQRQNDKPATQRYVLAVCFGLIHGLGFSNFLRSILGKTENIVWPLLYFNFGLEIGQLLIVFVLLALSYLLITLFKVKQKIWISTISSIVAIIALTLIWKNWVFL